MVTQTIIQKHTRLIKLSGSKDCQTVLTELGNYAIQQKLAKEGFTEALLEREQKFPTGIQAKSGIAIPHSEQDFTLKPTLIIALLDKSTLFHPMGGGEDVSVETVFLLLLDQAEHQVEMLTNIVSFIQDENKMQKLRSIDEAKDTILSFEKFFTSDKAG